MGMRMGTWAWAWAWAHGHMGMGTGMGTWAWAWVWAHAHGPEGARGVAMESVVANCRATQVGRVRVGRGVLGWRVQAVT